MSSCRRLQNPGSRGTRVRLSSSGPPRDLRSARLWRRGRAFDDFVEGDAFEHHWGRTVTETDNVLFSTATLAHNPLYFNAEYAASFGHRAIVVNPYLVLCVAIGLSVEDLSERSIAFLGLTDVAFLEPVYAGDTLTARSTVAGVRRSRSNPDRGVVTWRTEGLNQRGDVVVSFCRSNLFRVGDVHGGDE
jgi:itaconyl-CoA hydratase